jgi:flagella basal body P-ring formation protein FlgA
MRRGGAWGGRRRDRSFSRILLYSAILGCVAVAAQADTVTLRAVARVAAEDDIQLRDVAVLDGSYCRSLGDLTIDREDLAGRRGALVVDVQLVRQLLEEADVNWGRVSLTGRTCLVRPLAERTSIERAGGAEVAPTGHHDWTERDTLQAQIAIFIARRIGLGPDDLRLTFPADEAELLRLSIQDYRFELDDLTKPASPRIPVRATCWQHGKPVRSVVISVEVERRLPTVKLRRDVRRDERIGAADIDVESAWHDTDVTGLITSSADVIDRIAVKRLRAGDVLRDADLTQPDVVRKGDLVWVQCVVGNLVVRQQARADADAKLGDWVKLRLNGRRESFMAQVTGRGQAVLDLSVQPAAGEDR